MTSLFRGIGWRIFLSFSTLLIALTLLLSFIALKFAQKSATDNASNELRVLSVTLSGQLQRYFKRIETGLKSLSSASGFLDVELKNETHSRARIERFLSSKIGQLNLFESLSVFDVSGVCIASTDPDWEDLPAQREPFFVNGLKHLNFSDLFETNEGEEKVLLVSTPINEGNDPHGVLVGRVKLSTIYDLMGQQLALSGNAEAFLLDSRLRFITPAKSAPDELYQSHLASTPLVQHLQEEFWVGRYKNYKGDEVLGTVLKIPGHHWYLVLEREYQEVEKQLSEVKRPLFALTITLLFALILTTIVLTASITKPLQGLVESTQRIAAGELDRPVNIPAGADEITFLATEFDKMRAKLAASQGRLIEQLEESEQRRIENERLAAIGTLASSMAHEIRNPLNALSLLLSQFERSNAAPETKIKIIDNMRSEIGRLDRLVSDILDYARPLQLQREPLDLKSFLQSILDFYKATFEASKIQVRQDLASELGVIQADRDKLRQAFVNIIQNAIEAMPHGGEIIISGDRPSANQVRIKMKDTGVGIADSARKRLFDLFFTTKERGTGLGLSTVRKIVEAHRGSVDIQGAPQKGTTVTVILGA